MIAQRVKAIESSITMAITAQAKDLKASGKDVLSFGAGEPDFQTPEHIKQAGIRAINEGKTIYTAASGIIELKKAVCQKLKVDNQLIYQPNEIIITCGAKHALYNAIMALVDPGDEVIIPKPFWVSYPCQVQLAGGVPVYIDADDSTGFKITPQQLLKAITPKTKAVFINTPSNPTGAIYNQAELAALAEVCLAKNIYIISDEIYEKLVYGGEKHYSIAAVSEEVKNKTIVVNGVSKSYAMTGWRIGYSAAPLELTKPMEKIQSHSTSNATTPSQWAAVEALNGDTVDLEKMHRAFDERRLYMVKTLNQIPGITCLEPAGAFYVFPNVSALFGKSSATGKIQNSLEFCRNLLQEKYVACVPGSGFGSEGYIRLSYATSMEEIKGGLVRLEQWIKDLK